MTLGHPANRLRAYRQGDGHGISKQGAVDKRCRQKKTITNIAADLRVCNPSADPKIHLFSNTATSAATVVDATALSKSSKMRS
jgi:hypothetical protein